MAKYIETDFPFARLSVVAEQESWRKEVYRPVYYLHKWWARRLGSVFRGILLGACLDDSEDFWEHFYGINNFKNTVVYDPFMGSGVTLGESVKLGCKAAGRDINPVAYIACCAAFSQYDLDRVRSTYRHLESSLAPTLLSYYDTRTTEGSPATVLYYFLVKTVPCPKCGKNVDLFSTRIFSKNATPLKDPSGRSLCPTCGAINHTVYNAAHVKCEVCASDYNPQLGNIRGAVVHCDGCSHEFRLVDRMKSVQGPLPFRRYAKMILREDGIKCYEAPNSFDRELERKVTEQFIKISGSFPTISIEPGHNTDQMLKHNYRYWHELFSDRQLVCIKYMVDAIKKIEDNNIRLLFACLFSGVLEFNNLFTSFKGEGTGAVRHMFSHHVLKPEMMPIEANFWGTSKSSGAFSGLFHSRVEKALSYKADPFELRVKSAKAEKISGINQPMSFDVVGSYSHFTSQPRAIYLSMGDSSCIDMPDKSIDLVVTDPPFFDNVHYSELADFFYFCLNHTLDFSSLTTTRSVNEVQDINPAHFTRKLTSVFAECGRVLHDNGLLVFTYHHSRHEGWTSVHRAIRHAGFVCIQAYPIKAEMSVSMPLQQAKSPIHLDLILVCHKDRESDFGLSSSDPTLTALDVAKSQITSMKNASIQLSLGDTKVILMGRFLCEAHKMRNLDAEECFLRELENDIDAYVTQVISDRTKVLYKQSEPIQLSLFEEMEQYLANKRLQRTSDRYR